MEGSGGERPLTPRSFPRSSIVAKEPRRGPTRPAETGAGNGRGRRPTAKAPPSGVLKTSRSTRRLVDLPQAHAAAEIELNPSAADHGVRLARRLRRGLHPPQAPARLVELDRRPPGEHQPDPHPALTDQTGGERFGLLGVESLVREFDPLVDGGQEPDDDVGADRLVGPGQPIPIILGDGPLDLLGVDLQRLGQIAEQVRAGLAPGLEGPDAVGALDDVPVAEVGRVGPASAPIPFLVCERGRSDGS